MPASRDHRSSRPEAGPERHAPGHRLHSALPDAAFGAQELSVEAALLASAQQLFLRYMGATAQREPSPPDRDSDAGIAAADDLDPAALRACVDAIASLGRLAPPDLHADLEHERIWILMHLARHGTGLSRQRATQELRATLRHVSANPTRHRPLLDTLAQRLADIGQGAGRPAIFAALLAEVRQALGNTLGDRRR